MKINETKMKQAQEETLKILQEGEDKAEAIVEAMEKINSVQYDELIQEIVEQSNKAESDKEYAKTLGLRTLNKEEKEFFEALKNDPRQAVTGKQVDILPSTFIDVTLEDIKKESKLLNHIKFAPANVKKWITASKTGAFSWTGLTDKIKGELTANFAVLDMEVCKLTVYLVLPKAIRDLALPFVEKYCREILKEQLNDGLEYGALQGTGKNEPIGMYKQIAKTNSDGTHQDKTIETLTSFKPKALAAAKKYLTKNGNRTIDKLVLVCHPNDEADYVAPAIYNDEGRMIASYKNLEVVPCSNNPQGKALLLIPKKYTMGLTGLGFKDYDQTMALDDADVIIGKGYSNGRASDDNIAFVFDVTKLEEYVPAIKIVGTVSNTVEGEVTTKSEVAGA